MSTAALRPPRTRAPRRSPRVSRARAAGPFRLSRPSPLKSMDYLWTPWRYRYIAEARNVAGCVFCNLPAANDDRQSLIVLRGVKNFIILNRYPYTSGHVMIVPYLHTADFPGL